MLHPEIGSLEGVTLLHSPDMLTPNVTGFGPDSDTRKRITAFHEAERHTMEIARRHGATIRCVADPEDITADPNKRVYWQSRTYFDAHDAIKRFEEEHSISIGDMRRIRPYQFASLEPDEREARYTQLLQEGPWVAAYAAVDNGHVKYLISDITQMRRFVEFVLDFTKTPRPFVRPASFELRPFLETPSNHYTSFRFILSPLGTLLAAGLHYSAHTKNDPSRQHIKNDRFSDSRPGSVVRLIKERLEEPKSKDYIGGPDIRSNSAVGGRIIGLTGQNRRPPTPQEKDILAAHHINPELPEPPSKQADIARYIGKTLGPFAHHVLASDFLDAPYLETNITPGGGVYAACHLEGGGTMLERYIAMRMHSLADLSR